MEKKLNIAVVAGGDSSEYEISLKSAANVVKNLDTSKYQPFLIIMRGSDWHLQMPGKRKFAIDKNDFSCTIGDDHIKFDCVFVAIHGTPGEDGKLQGYLDMMKIPYTSSGVYALSLTFNKHTCKEIVSAHGITTPVSVLVRSGKKHDLKKIIIHVKLPCFVKPNNGGSSCGASKVKEEEQLKPAIDKALNEDHEAIIEQFIAGTELTCGILMKDGEPMALPVTEIVSKNEFFDYEAKYTPGVADEITPARISKEIEKECKKISVKVFKLLDCRGIARADFILSENKLHFLEINTVPGLTEVSIIPKQVEAMGLSPKELFTMVIEETLRGK